MGEEGGETTGGGGLFPSKVGQQLVCVRLWKEGKHEIV